MRPLHELINTEDPAFPLVREWAAKALRSVELLPPSAARDDALLRTQVTTRSPMGAVVYETGGVLIDHGWLRVLGSGHPRLARTLPGWNESRGQGFYLVADDAVGGFFAINGGAFGDDLKDLYYFAPDSLAWEPLHMGYSAFLEWACLGKLDGYYEPFRWPGWEAEVARLQGDRCLMTFPPLWIKDSQPPSARRGEVPVEEAWGVQMEFLEQLGPPGHDTP
jgi:hypothetical protein